MKFIIYILFPDLASHNVHFSSFIKYCHWCSVTHTHTQQKIKEPRLLCWLNAMSYICILLYFVMIHLTTWFKKKSNHHLINYALTIYTFSSFFFLSLSVEHHFYAKTQNSRVLQLLAHNAWLWSIFIVNCKNRLWKIKTIEQYPFVCLLYSIIVR